MSRKSRHNPTDIERRESSGRREADIHAMQVQGFSAFIGPLPPPEALAKYGQIDPELPRKLFERAERQAVGRQRDERFRAHVEGAAHLVAVVGGWLTATAGLGAATYLAIHGHDWVAAVIAGTGLAPIVRAVVHRPQREKK